MTFNMWFGNTVRLLVSAGIMLTLTANASAAWKEKVLYSFQGGSDGYQPSGGVVFDRAGNLYGANSWGGSGGCPSPGCGTVFEISPPAQKGGQWTETTIYAFQGVVGSHKDGLTPEGGLIIDQQGNLYGTTTLGGSGPCILLGSPAGCGIVYELSPPTQKGGPWTETILYSFQGGNDGYFPIGDLVFDKHGNLYGATWFGGGQGSKCDLYYGGNCGTVFKLSPPTKKGEAWTEKVLQSFAGGTDGANPNGELSIDSTGAVYGTTLSGGNQNCNYGSGFVGCGTAFKLAPPTKKNHKWAEAVIHRFGSTGSKDGGVPMAGMVQDVRGRLYGTASNGGPGPGGGVFCLIPPAKGSGSWKETILYGFNDKDGGWSPEGTLVFGTDGSLYGTTYDSAGTYSGTVFRLRPPNVQGNAWTFSFLYRFTGTPDGAQPATSLIFGKAGKLYSTTTLGGTGTACQFGCGTLFEVSP